jgi:hypothetical protein
MLKALENSSLRHSTLWTRCVVLESLPTTTFAKAERALFGTAAHVVQERRREQHRLRLKLLKFANTIWASSTK